MFSPVLPLTVSSSLEVPGVMTDSVRSSDFKYFGGFKRNSGMSI